MDAPDLDRVWETFLRIGQPTAIHAGQHIELLRTYIAPLIADLRARHLIAWYSFLVHDHRSGVPTHPEDPGLFWHLRLTLGADVREDALLDCLRPNFEMTRHVPRADLMSILGIESRHLEGNIDSAWQILGEQSEWLLRALAIYRNDITVQELTGEILQYLHFYANMTQLRVQ